VATGREFSKESPDLRIRLGGRRGKSSKMVVSRLFKPPILLPGIVRMISCSVYVKNSSTFFVKAN